jgi:ABC-type amino acid transport substrate-binding protein
MRNQLFVFLLLALATKGIFANSKQVTIVSDNAPPHIISESDSGIDLDIAIQAFQSIGHSVVVVYAPLGRGRLLVKNGVIDVALPSFYEAETDGMFVSTPLIEYKPTLFTRKNTTPIKSFADLKGLSVATFQGASEYFADQLKDISSSDKYREFSDMSILPELLLKGRVDVVLLDYYIFHYFGHRSMTDYSQEYVIASNIIPRVNAYAVFNDEQLRDDFNEALSHLKMNGQDVNIVNKYLNNEQLIEAP